MPPFPAWKRTLIEARRQALVAVEFYNRPGDRRSFPDFIVHMHLAWQNLLHADRMCRGENIYYRTKRRYERNPDGTKKTWDLSRCLKAEFGDQDPIRMNIEFFVGLRNHVEHRFQDSVISVTASEAHALIINFEAELVRRFGLAESLAGELKFPVFVQTLSPSDFAEQQELRRGLSQPVKTFISEFQKGVSLEALSDARYAYRLVLMPLKGPKTDADQAISFVNRADLTEEEMARLSGREGSVIFAEKFREAAHVYDLLPSKVAQAVEEHLGYSFAVHDFTKVRKALEIGPKRSGSRDPLPKSESYCVYSPAFGQFVYRAKLVDKLVSELSTPECFQRLVGHLPVPIA